MENLNLAENLARMRKKKGITQEELANFIGVTKASVSKWETRQSLPDLLMLPRLAAFFDVTVDELIGYVPQLAREQIRKIYYELAAEFAVKPFDEAYTRCRTLIKTYYSCYPFLFQMSVLLFNHFMLAPAQEQQKQTLEEAEALCGHIKKECRDLALCTDAAVLQASIRLQLGKVQDVVECLEETCNPYRIAGQADTILMQAYRMTGKEEKAESYAQISMFQHLLLLMNSSVYYLDIQKENREICEETIRRMDQLCETYELDKLAFHIAAVYHIQAAVTYCFYGEKEEALRRLKKYVAIMEKAFSDQEFFGHGDRYFDKIGWWYEESDLGAAAPRDKKVIFESALSVFGNPAFACLTQEPEFQRLQAALQKKGGAHL